MTNSALAAEPQSSEKEKSRVKTYRIPISNGIFEHYPKLKDARWLLDLFVDWTTKEVPAGDDSFDGIVLGGKPICDEDTSEAFGIGGPSARTTRRWRCRLAHHGYISQKRTPIGYGIRVKKSKKWPERSAKNGLSELPVVADLTGHDRQFRTTSCGRANKDSAVQDKDRAVEEAAAASPGGETKSKPHPCWKVVGLKPCGTLKFCRGWEDAYEAAPTGEDLVDLMESFIQYCQAKKIPVPPPFYRAKHRMQAEENKESDEMSRMSSGGPTYNGPYSFPTHKVWSPMLPNVRLLAVHIP
jgi:hypothetical protein